MNKKSRCGFIALVGRPNVGKSTLLNKLVGEKVSIISPKPQTTRHQIMGICTQESTQAVFVDTPGIHQSGQKAINRYMNKAALSVIGDVDLVLFLIDITRWTPEDEYVFNEIIRRKAKVIMIGNKIDKIKRENVLEKMASLIDKTGLEDIVPVSATKNDNLDYLKQLIFTSLPESPFMFPEDQITDKNESFVIAEFIREKLFCSLQQELPYALTVQIENIERDNKLVRIHAIIWVEKDSQKNIVIGAKGKNLKRVGQLARKDIEAFLKQKVYLNLWVKTKDGWANSEKMLHLLGYGE